MQYDPTVREKAEELYLSGMGLTEISFNLGVPRSTLWGWARGFDAPEEEETPAEELKVLFYDIETAPSLAYIWRPNDDYVQPERLIHDTFLLSWSAKWSGDDSVMGEAMTPSAAVAQDDTHILTQLAELIRSADIVVAHNGDSFDLPTINYRLLKSGIRPLGPVKTIDTLTLARKNFRIAYNSLDYLGGMLGLGRKEKTSFELWSKCYHGDRDALAEMLKYNKKDVILLESVFNALKPYVKGLPRMVDAIDVDQIACPSCGSESLEENGKYRTNANTFQRYECKSCGRYCRSKQPDADKRLGVSVVS